MRAGQAGTALGLGRLGRSSNCSSFIYHQGQGADRTYRAVLIGNHDPPLYRISHPPRVVSTPGTIPRYKLQRWVKCSAAACTLCHRAAAAKRTGQVLSSLGVKTTPA